VIYLNLSFDDVTLLFINFLKGNESFVIDKVAATEIDLFS